MTTDPTDIQADLAALADGSLVSERVEEVTRRVESSPEHTQALADQRRVLALIDSNRATAPESLHRTVQSLRPARAPRRRGSARWSRIGAGALAGAAAVFVVLLLTGGGQTSLSVGQAAALGLRAATAPSPAESPSDRGVLSDMLDGISYPYWGKRFGFNTAGTRTDRLAGRTIKTVFYRNSRGQRIGYSIVAGRALAIPKSKVLKRGGVVFWVLDQGGATVLTWRRAGHTCILISRGVDGRTLLHLAGWRVS